MSKKLKPRLFPVRYTYNQFHILRLFDVLPNFPLVTRKRCAIITYKLGIYELPNDLTLKLLQN